MMGGVTSGLVVLGSIRKQDEHAMKNKPKSSTLRWHLHPVLVLFEFLPWLSSVIDYNVEVWGKGNPLVLSLLLIMVFHRGGSHPKTVMLSPSPCQSTSAKSSSIVQTRWMHLLVLSGPPVYRLGFSSCPSDICPDGFLSLFWGLSSALSVASCSSSLAYQWGLLTHTFL